MNVAISVLFSTGAIFFFFLNIDYVEARLTEKVFNIIVVLTPILTAVTLYKNDSSKLCKTTFFSNIIVLIAYSLWILRVIHRGELDAIITLVLFTAPFVINIAQLNSLLKLNAAI